MVLITPDEQIDDSDAIDLHEYYEDVDNDGFGFLGSKFYSCVLPDGYVENSVDCDDNNPNINPDMNELCSTEEDDNCDGFVNENTAIDTTVYYQDADEDGYGIPNYFVNACTTPAGYAARQGDDWDCDDNDPSARPHLPEYCNEWDDDCDGLINESFEEDNISPVVNATFFYVDSDNDGFGLMGSEATVEVCPDDLVEGVGFTNDNTDCDDNDQEINPAAEEDCLKQTEL